MVNHVAETTSTEAAGNAEEKARILIELISELLVRLVAGATDRDEPIFGSEKEAGPY